MNHERVKVVARGAVQGVGFRPFVYRLASELQLSGWVQNSAAGVFIEVEGERASLNQFLLRLENDKPPLAIIQSLESSFLDPVGYGTFEIRASDDSGTKRALILPDIATCADCRRDIFDPSNRRYLYPFTNCTNCGPRFSIIESLPYDRPNTVMKKFALCPDCEREYHDPNNRRFHAQPNACPSCGPQSELWNGEGQIIGQRFDALFGAIRAIRAGKIVALKGIGGFQFLVDARDENAVHRLRERKHREEKPLAVMFSSLAEVKAVCLVSDFEARLLQSPEAPIVLLSRLDRPHPGPFPQEREKLSVVTSESGRGSFARHSEINSKQAAIVSTGPEDSAAFNGHSLSPGERAGVRASVSQIAPSVAPRNPYLGAMLPHSPLHHILLRELGFPIVATSGNLSGEPICIEEHEAVERLRGIADVFLVHNRPIVRQVDDSVARVLLGRQQILRRARGYAPLPIHVQQDLPAILAVGAHLKNTVALSVGRDIFLSQHIGDLESPQALNAFRRGAAAFERLYETTPKLIACDLHPEYLSTKHAQEMGTQLAPVQHHYAHIAACMAENEIASPVFGIAWDGTGYGLDGTIWGGEFLVVDETSFERFAHFREFRLPGGETAIKQPRRAALGMLFEMFGEGAFERGDLLPIADFAPNELALLRQALARGVNALVTCSAGRLFDAVASLTGLRQRAIFEGQAAMELEFAIERGVESSFPFGILEREGLVVDWQPMIQQLLVELHRHEPVGGLAAKFHNTLVEIILAVAKRAGIPRVALSGGCFQNKYLTERAVTRLREEGFRPYWHQRIPPNDGGIALGQVFAAARMASSQTAAAIGVENVSSEETAANFNRENEREIECEPVH